VARAAAGRLIGLDLDLDGPPPQPHIILAKASVRCLILSEGGNMKSTAAMILVACLSTTAQAVETGTLTLACKGTTVSGIPDAKPEPFSMSLIVNSTAGTVQGFGVPGLRDPPVRITGINEVTVAFGGSTAASAPVPGLSNWSLNGTIDRVTGEVEASEMATDAKTGNRIYLTSYSLKCRPTQRMF
jgi:hypothetical protein